jgi:hypothetical protein
MGPALEEAAKQAWEIEKDILGIGSLEDCLNYDVESCLELARDALLQSKLKLLGRTAAVLSDLMRSGCTQCFLAGTKVQMADSSRTNIEDVRVGDLVLATDPVTGETGPRAVLNQIITEDDKHFDELTLATRDGSQKLTATYEHPFWSPSAHRWLKARELTPGTTLLSSDGSTVEVTANRSFDQHARTYNLTIDGLHTYYVLAGGTPVLVHNSTCGGIALGYGEVDGDPLALQEFAETTGGKSYHDWPSMGDDWVKEFQDYVEDGTTPIHFNLDGIDDPVAAARVGETVDDPRIDGHATKWELAYIKNHPNSWSRVKFYRGGVEKPNPFS